MVSTIVVLVGRPNVGKSTIFNYLTGTRAALVLNTPSVTRDRRYGILEFRGYSFTIIDTGSIEHTKKNSIVNLVFKQSLLAIEEADIILFIVDARSGILPEDHEIAKLLYKIQKPTILVVNKIDGMDGATIIGEFYELGFSEIYAMIASHGQGINNIIKKSLIPWANKINSQKIMTQNIVATNNSCVDLIPIKLAIVGRPNVGKSTFINCILGNNRMLVSNIPGTTRDSIDVVTINKGYKYIITDTAGIKKKHKNNNLIEKFAIVKTIQAITKSHVTILLIDAAEKITKQDLTLLNFILKTGKSVVIGINKWDRITKNIQLQIKDNILFDLKFANFIRVHFISALYNIGITNFFNSIVEAFTSATKNINTSTLMRIMNQAEEDHQPPIINGRRIKLKYVHMGGYNPPIIIIHGNQVTKITSAYKKYLTNYFLNQLNIRGTPIKIIFKDNLNPFN